MMSERGSTSGTNKPNSSKPVLPPIKVNTAPGTSGRNPGKLSLSGACASGSSHPSVAMASASMALDRRAIGTPPPQSLRKPFQRPPYSPLVGEPSDSNLTHGNTDVNDSSKCQIFILDRGEDDAESGDVEDADERQDGGRESEGEGGLIPPTRLVARPVDGVVFEVTRSEMSQVTTMTPFTSTTGLAARRRNRTDRP